jgi:hypothetical protein
LFLKLKKVRLVLKIKKPKQPNKGMSIQNNNSTKLHKALALKTTTKTHFQLPNKAKRSHHWKQYKQISQFHWQI